MYKTLQLFSLHQTQTYLQALKLLKHTYTDTKVIKNAERIKAWIKLKPFIVLGILK